MSNDKPRAAREVVHASASARLICTAGSTKAWDFHSAVCDFAVDAIERDRAERAGTGATRLRDVPYVRTVLRDLLWAAAQSATSATHDGLARWAIDSIDDHLRKAMPAAPAEPNAVCPECGNAPHVGKRDGDGHRGYCAGPAPAVAPGQAQQCDMRCYGVCAQPMGHIAAGDYPHMCSPAPAPLRDWARGKKP